MSRKGLNQRRNERREEVKNRAQEHIRRVAAVKQVISDLQPGDLIRRGIEALKDLLEEKAPVGY